MYVEIEQDSIAIYKTKGQNMTEVVGWHKNEWIEDPSIIISIANAINMAHLRPKELINTLNQFKHGRTSKTKNSTEI